jgi:anti-sigma regulatory factor (Ser/Thr protein kinase)
MTVAEWSGGLGTEFVGRAQSSITASASLPEPLRLSFSARPEQVALARHALAAWGRQAGLDRRGVDDLQTIANEACMNAATHAYSGDDGRIEVAADAADGVIELSIADNGGGIQPRPADPNVSRRLGLLLIAALASRVEICSTQGEGTHIRATLER